MNTLLTQGPTSAATHLILAHGAGAPMTSPWLETMTDLLITRRLRVTRFEFAYMAARRTGTRKPPPKAERLVPDYLDVVTTVAASLTPGQRLAIGGKSMGGRVASLVAGELYDKDIISGLICLGYPFHPPKQPESLRTSHLETLTCPTLVVQGARDPFGLPEEVATYRLSPSIDIVWLTDGDHDFSPRAASGTTAQANLAHAADAVARFCATAHATARR